MFNTLRLTDSQVELLVRIYSSPTPEIAKAETEFGENHIETTKQLQQLEVIDVTDTTVMINDHGQEMMQQQGLIDEMGELTTLAQNYSTGENHNTTSEMDLNLEPTTESFQILHKLI